VSGDTGFFSLENLRGLRERGIDGYVPDANLSYEKLSHKHLQPTEGLKDGLKRGKSSAWI
jgi:hypothetical protein